MSKKIAKVKGRIMDPKTFAKTFHFSHRCGCSQNFETIDNEIILRWITVDEKLSITGKMHKKSY